MSGFLLDTNVISEFRRQRPHGGVKAWLMSVSAADLHISAATIQEIQAGIELTRESNPDRAIAIEDWLDDVMADYNIIAVDGAVFRSVAKLMHRKQEHLFSDAIIAATALLHQMTVVTRNVQDFAPFAVPTLNPFEHR